jgi:hypothetical protein
MAARVRQTHLPLHIYFARDWPRACQIYSSRSNHRNGQEEYRPGWPITLRADTTALKRRRCDTWQYKESDQTISTIALIHPLHREARHLPRVL